MTRHPEARLRPRGAIFALAVVGALLGANSSAASCGSHVQIGEEPARCAPGETCPVAPLPVVPCHGPSCSRGHDGDPVAPPIVAPRLSDDAALVVPWRAPRSSSGQHRAADDQLRALHSDSPPAPPPRAT